MLIMVSLNSLSGKLDKIKNDFLRRHPRKVLMFIEEDNLPARKISLQYNGKNKIVYCNNEKEWEELVDRFIDYDKLMFIKLKKPDPEDVAVAND